MPKLRPPTLVAAIVLVAATVLFQTPRPIRVATVPFEAADLIFQPGANPKSN